MLKVWKSIYKHKDGQILIHKIVFNIFKEFMCTPFCVVDHLRKRGKYFKCITEINMSTLHLGT